MSLKVPEWLEDAIRKCKEGNERACEVVRDYLDLLKREYLQSRSALVGGTLITVIIAIVSTFWKISLIISLFLVLTCTVYVIYVSVDVWRTKEILACIYNTYLDPPMNDRILFIGTALTIGMVILTLIVAYLLHRIPLM